MAMKTADESPSAKRWLPLEAHPDLMNQFVWGLELPMDEAEFYHVYGFDDELLEMVPKPVLAVIFLFPITAEECLLGCAMRDLYKCFGTLNGQESIVYSLLRQSNTVHCTYLKKANCHEHHGTTAIAALRKMSEFVKRPGATMLNKPRGSF